VASVLLRHGVAEAVRGIGINVLLLLNCTVGALHHTKYLREPLAVLGNTLVWLSEGQLLPGQVVCLLANQVHNLLVARSTVDWSEVLPGEHSVVLISLLSLVGSHHKVIQIFNVLLQVEDLLAHSVLVRETVT